MGYHFSPLLRTFSQATPVFCSLIIFASISVASTDFDRCKEDFRHITNTTSGYLYRYTGLLYNGAKLNPEDQWKFISLPGCLELCGKGTDYYHWADVSKTITTWVLPIIGLLLQLPFESNQFWNTNYALVRWMGSPIASLSYILWNIKMIGKAALLSDMSTEYRTHPQKDDEAADMRDSLFILSVMNQYTPKPSLEEFQATSLLRIALFAREFPQPEKKNDGTPDPKSINLVERRRKLARELREGRKRGIVPVFISLLWFVFALVISIQDAFGEVGSNATAHDLAIGLLLAWFPVLVVSGIVDRNPVLTETTREKINEFLVDVQDVLEQGNLLPDGKTVAEAFSSQHGIHQSNLGWIRQTGFASDFFAKMYAGQGRVRWHYGVAHPILSGMESSIIIFQQRDWLNIENIESILVCGPTRDVGLWEFDAREVWEIFSALAIVAGTISGAFVISFRTPTVGLGCRAGGYVIFGSIALGLFTFELLAWFVMSKMDIRVTETPDNQGTRWPTILNGVFRLGELVNTAWLVYIVAAQTVGGYQTCSCQLSTWSRWGGYLDFETNERASGVQAYWITGAVLSASIMFIAISFLVAEWCEQSHLNTEDFDQAMKGLRVTRWYKKHTIWIRRIPDWIIGRIKDGWHHLTKGEKKRGRQSVVWCE